MFKKLLLTGMLFVGMSVSVFAGGDQLTHIPIKKLDTLAATLASGSDYVAVYDASADATKKVDVALMGAMASAQAVTPDAVSGGTITAGVTLVDVQAVTNDANDWIVLPSVADVPIGFEITIICMAGANFELRTPATSAEEINSEDCDGTKEYLCTDTQIVKVIKIDDTIDWMAHGYTAIGAVATAVIPD